MAFVEDEALRRSFEEFFLLPPDIRHIPLGAAGLAKDISLGLQTPELQDPFERFLLEVNRFPQIEGLIILIDAFYNDVDLDTLAESEVSLYVFGQIMLPDGQEEEELDFETSETLFNIIEDAGNERLRIGVHLINLIYDDSFIPAATDFIRNLFHKNPQPIPFAMDEKREEPPSACFIVIVDPPPTI